MSPSGPVAVNQQWFFWTPKEARAFYREQQLKPPWLIIRGFDMARELEISYPSEKPVQICIVDVEEAYASLYGEFVIPVDPAESCR